MVVFASMSWTVVLLVVIGIIIIVARSAIEWIAMVTIMIGRLIVIIMSAIAGMIGSTEVAICNYSFGCLLDVIVGFNSEI